VDAGFAQRRQCGGEHDRSSVRVSKSPGKSGPRRSEHSYPHCIADHREGQTP
jgi:hypothetical protein